MNSLLDRLSRKTGGYSPNVFFLGAARAFVADLVPAEKRGTAYGLYHGAVGLTLLPASLIAGWLWQAYSPSTPFFFGAGLAGAAVVGMILFVRE